MSLYSEINTKKLFQRFSFHRICRNKETVGVITAKIVTGKKPEIDHSCHCLFNLMWLNVKLSEATKTTYTVIKRKQVIKSHVGSFISRAIHFFSV
jgi:hypothetical protein